MRVLFADAPSSEFGWELMSWQAYVRAQAPKYNKVIVCTTQGREPLYSDFCKEFIVHNVGLLRDCHKYHKVYDPRAWKQFEGRKRKAIRDLRQGNHKVHVVRPDRLIDARSQKFIRYGDADQARDQGHQFDVVLHARNKRSNDGYYSVYNWPVERWNSVVVALNKGGLRVAAVGTHAEAWLPDGAEDLRGLPLDKLMNLMAASDLVIGPSSGPMHLASLCGTPHFVWTGKHYSTTINAYNRDRYETLWNPFKTPCTVLDHTPDLMVKEVLETTVGLLNGKADTVSVEVADPQPKPPAQPKGEPKVQRPVRQKVDLSKDVKHPIGVAILCYEGFHDLTMSLNAVDMRTTLPHQLVVFDNSEKTKDIRKYVKRRHPDVAYLAANKNVGCTRSRNLIFNHFLKNLPEAEFMVVLDQDVEVQLGWLEDMMEVALSYPDDTGIVAWPQAFRFRTVHQTGLVSEVASMCNLHRIAPLLEAREKWGGPFDERFFFHKFDSLICQRLNQLHWHTRLVMKHYRKGRPWSKQVGGIVHRHPNSGVRRNPQYNQIVTKSKQLYAQLQKTEGWSNWGSNLPVLTRENTA